MRFLRGQGLFGVESLTKALPIMAESVRRKYLNAQRRLEDEIAPLSSRNGFDCGRSALLCISSKNEEMDAHGPPGAGFPFEDNGLSRYGSGPPTHLLVQKVKSFDFAIELV